MKSYSKLPNKLLYLVLIPCAIIIFSSSIETMMKVKDISLYQNWLVTLNNSDSVKMTYDRSFDAYLTANLIFFLFKIIIPVALSMNTYLIYTRFRVNKLFIFVWIVLVFGGLLYTLVEQSFYSIFYYINIIGYSVLVIAILAMNKSINDNKAL